MPARSRAPRGPRGRIPWDALALLLVLNLVVGAAGWVYSRVNAARVRGENLEKLEAIAGLKASEVDAWRSERLVDAWAFYENTVLSRAIIAFIGAPTRADRQAEVDPILEMVTRRAQYRTVTIVDGAGRPLLSFPPSTPPLGTAALGAAAALARGKTPALSDPLLDTDGSIVVLAVAPVLDPAGGAGLGAVVLAMDPHASLYPSVASWPVPSPTAEALLVQGSGDRIRYLSPLRFRSGTGLVSLGFDEVQSLVAAKAVRGLQGPTQGNDYRGVPVYATIRKVSGMTWYLVVKVDRSEVESAARSVSRLALAAALIVGLVLSAWVLARQARQAARSRAEQDRLRARLDKAREMESVALLAAGVAHDFNNILAGISGAAEVIRGRSAEPETRGTAEKLLAATRRAAHTVEGLLAFAEQQRLRRRPVELNGLVRAQQEAMAAILGPAVALGIDPSPSEAWILGDEDLLADVLTHLAGTARAAMPRGGSFTVQVQTVGAAPGRPSPGTAPPAGWVHLRVTDTGEGLTEEARGRIFEPFYGARVSGASAGIGLAAVHGIVRQHGGTIEVQSVPGRGSAFTILLPREPAPGPGTRGGPAPSAG